jgi:proteasome lid subunit RPN8/RPN11
MARPSVELPAWLAGEIRHQAQIAAPRECCGLVEGLRQGGHFQVMALHPARNLALEPQRFEIDPRDHLAASKTARARGHQLIGCYHSHPEGAARPSSRDAEGAAEENFLWLIAAAGELAAFIYLGGEFLGADWTMPSA